MFRLQAARITTHLVRFRPYATATPPPPAGSNFPRPKVKEPDNAMLYTVLGIAAAAGAYLYFRKPDDEVNNLKHQVNSDREELMQKGKETFDAATTTAGDTVRQGGAKFGGLREGSKERMDAARSRAENAAREVESRGRSIGGDLEEKYDAAKSSAREGLTRARDSTESLYNEAKASTDGKVAQARQEAERKTGQVKEGWFSWLGWGKSKVSDGANKVEAEADRVKSR